MWHLGKWDDFCEWWRDPVTTMKQRQELEKNPTEDKSCLLRCRECTRHGKEFKDVWTKI